MNTFLHKFVIASGMCLTFVVCLTVHSPYTQSRYSLEEQIQFGNFLRDLFSDGGISCKCTLQIVMFQRHQAQSILQEKWANQIDFILALSNSDTVQSSGTTISSISSSTTSNTLKYRQPSVLQYARRCSAVIIVWNKPKVTIFDDGILMQELANPILTPATVRNRDNYIILSEHDKVPYLTHSKFIKSIKYKVILTVNSSAAGFSTTTAERLPADFSVSISRPCHYGMSCINGVYVSPGKPTDLVKDRDLLFPDHEKNYFGHTLRLSTTPKVPELLEMNIIASENNTKIYKPKRGLYAKVLIELVKRLNFTFEIVPSSGNGSTGHALPNGTMVGIVGDTYDGTVDFGFMAAINSQRFSYAELCAPINYAYMGFVTGPSTKSYSWKAILWPFTKVMWFLVFTTIFISTLCIAIISKTTNRSPGVSTDWRIFASFGFLMRGILEQCDELPRKMSPSFRILVTFWLFFCLVCSAAYRSKMVSLLTFPIFHRIPASYDELAVSKDFKIDFHYFGNVGYTYFKTSTNPAIMAIYGKMNREPSSLKCLQHTLIEKVACITYILTFENAVHKNLSDQYGKTPLKFRPQGDPFAAGVIHQHKAPLSVNFRSVLFPSIESGLLPLWLQEDLNGILKKKNHWRKANQMDLDDIWGDDKNQDDILRVRNLQGAFVIFILGIVASVIAFGMESTKRHAFRLLKVSHFW